MSANETDAAPRKSQSEILEHKLNRMKFLTGLTDELYHDALSFRDVNRARLADDTPEMRIAKRRAYATISAIELNPKTAEKIYKDAAVLRTENQRYQAEANTPADPFVGETSTVAGEFSKDAQLMNMHDEKKWKEKENVALSGSANPLVSSWSATRASKSAASAAAASIATTPAPSSKQAKQAAKTKRKREEQDAYRAEQRDKRAKNDRNFAPCVGDWQCGECEWWNIRFFYQCRNSKMECSGNREQCKAVQAAGPGIQERKCRATYYNDWMCRCGHWNRSPFDCCHDCLTGKSEGWQYTMIDDKYPKLG